MKVQIPYAKNMVELEVPESQVVGVRVPRSMPPASDPDALLRQSIESAMEERGLAAKAGPAARACIAITDRTRSTPNKRIVPMLIDQLNTCGVPDQNITVISSGGMHAPDSREDILRTVGQAVLDRVEAITNDPDNDAVMTPLGTTDMGTPVEVHRRFAEADIKIGVTNVMPCMLAGWSGSGKIVMPGVSSRRSIYHNHKQFVKPLLELRCSSLLGIMPPHNPVRADIEQCATVSGLDMVVNTVLNSQRRLVDVFCGEHVAAHRAARDRMLPDVEVSLPQAVDVLIAGVGDPALEVSLFQGGSRVCGGVDRTLRPGGTLVMANACWEGIYEGFEHEEYRDWMRQMPTPVEIGQLVEDDKMGGEKGCVLFTFSWLLHEMKCRIIVVTDGMTADELGEVHLDHASSVQQAADDALSSYAGGASIGIMPYGGLVLPTLPPR
ncbi:MAG TPA: nickel-dependent lactate racemase [Anaerolineae bacterium]|nr:nickel-dependent lactate racemase [Anaerolineae bacterium]